ncbi:MAG: DUF3013 family protein [Atopococcus tabaci]|uniref:DUF3013 family protein n=1 Tax=Atopococcus tabaci TaxID=269774 RepID=A0AA43RJQ4_9LACT|nr:DUF3013 family protein [Atopococcus tabaci]
MEETEFSTYFCKMMEESQANFYWDLSYNEEQEIHECFFMLESEIPEDASYKLMDARGRVNTSEKLLLADRIAFYDLSSSYIDPGFYLKAFPVDKEEGIEKGFIEAFIKYLHQLVNGQRVALENFLKQDNTQVPEEQFAFTWQDESFRQTIKTLKDTQRYDFDKITFDLTETKDKNILEKLKDD